METGSSVVLRDSGVGLKRALPVLGLEMESED
jgi:hypothetical protein